MILAADDLAPSDAVEGNTIDTTKLDVGSKDSGEVVMEDALNPADSEDKVVFDGADAGVNAQ